VGTGVPQTVNIRHLGAFFEGLAFGGHGWKWGAKLMPQDILCFKMIAPLFPKPANVCHFQASDR
jgi:hypothetical protein